MRAKRLHWLTERLLLIVTAVLVVCVSSADSQVLAPLKNRSVTVSVRPEDGSFVLRAEGLKDPVLTARVGAEINHGWVWSNDYPSHQARASSFRSPLGSGHQTEVLFKGLAGKPDLQYALQLYDDLSFGDIQVQIRNSGQESFTIQNIRILDVVGRPPVSLGGPDDSDRVLSDSFSEDRPPLHIVDLGKARTYLGEDAYGKDFTNVHFGVGSQLIYNQRSGFSLLLAALTSDRWLTVLRLNTEQTDSSKVQISSYAVDSTGTTEILKKESLRDNPASDQIELSLSVRPGDQIASEKLMFAVGRDYHAQLETYGEAIRVLHQALVSKPAPWGWWSWTAYYFGLSQATALSNARWLSEHLKSLGFDFFHIDEGYAYADGEFTTPNATLFPDGIRELGQAVCQLGLKFGMWIAPFRVSQRAWIYENHPDWLVHNANGKPIQIGFVESSHDPLYVLDTTHPGAQEYLRHSYEILTREWGARYLKLDFMDDTAIEGYHYQPDTTALEAEQIGLKIIRDAVGPNVLLDKDGSPMLNAVGFTDEGRISTDTGHSFQGTKEDATGIAARYYMNGRFFVADPDALTVSKQLITDRSWHQSKAPLSLDEAETSIVLAAVAGGMFELGDDLPTLGAEPDRLQLLHNRDLLDMVRLGRAAKPLDLMTYSPEDAQPSVFLLREDQRQSMLAVFNWTDGPRSHGFSLSELGLQAKDTFKVVDVFQAARLLSFSQGTLRIKNQPPHSVRLMKIVDTSVPPRAPSISLLSPDRTQLGHAVDFSATAGPDGVPALAYHWQFGDGTTAEGSSATHAYTQTGSYTIRLKVDGLDGVAAVKDSSITVQGTIKTTYDVPNSRRYEDRRP